jgi:osmotically-inducible protein OsmY
MNKTFAIPLMLGLAACGDKPSLAPVAEAATPKVITAAAEPVNDVDQQLAQRVMRAIDEARLNGIEAVSTDGVVTLWGTTVSDKDRHRAGEIALRVEGVKAVDNRLEVVSGS